MTHEEAVLIAKNTFKRLSKEGLYTALSSTPFVFLTVPPLRILTDKAFDWILTVIVDKGETGAFFLYINFTVDAQGRAFMAAAIFNHYAQINGTPSEKLNAETSLKNAFRNLIRLSN